ncbi:hypothetical protein GIB67_011098 [Kingdonia uniflora]|uniref:Uncharacterized protein n=1 Tax=Kingdonia uniflora TaxID=39325 RepID=A0A7J7PA70_9MAGN|nr:hypothetical protein GIB67_011098 [Kingdonia uniflora]
MGNLKAFTCEDGLIMQGEDMNYVMKNRFDPSNGHRRGTSCCGGSLSYDVILPEWPLKLGGLNDKGRRAEYDHLFWCDVFYKFWVWASTVESEKCFFGEEEGKLKNDLLLFLQSLKVNVLAGSSMRSKPINPMSKSVVLSSLKETSSSGRDDDCYIREEIVDKIEVIVGVEAGEPSEVERVRGYEACLRAAKHCLGLSSPNPTSLPDNSKLFDGLALEQVELKQVLGALGIQRDKRNLEKEVVKPTAEDAVEEQVVSGVDPVDLGSLKRIQHDSEGTLDADEGGDEVHYEEEPGVRRSYILVDSERGLKEAYVELLKVKGVVPDPARVRFLAQEAHNRHSVEAKKCSARAGVSVIWGDVEPLPDAFEFM